MLDIPSFHSVKANFAPAVKKCGIAGKLPIYIKRGFIYTLFAETTPTRPLRFCEAYLFQGVAKT